MRPESDKEVARRAARQWGVLSLAELQECGLTPRAVSRRVRSGRLHRLHRGVYAVGHRNVPLNGRFLAAVKACGPTAVLSHYSAAALWGVVVWDGRPIEVTVASTARRKHRGLRIHRTQNPERTRRAGIPVTPPARTLIDLAATLPFKPLRRAVRQAQALRLVSLAELAGARSRTLAEILAAGPAPTRSELEDAVLELMLRGGLQRPDVNVPMTLAGRTVVPDFRWPGERLVVEADGREWHDNRLAREDDVERQALLEARGERVVRVTWRQAVARPQETLARIRAAGAPSRRGARP
jgi:very-short-patch-repair endonuclease